MRGSSGITPADYPEGPLAGIALQRRLEEACDKLLANPVIEDYRFEEVKA